MTFALHQSDERTHSECPRSFYARRFEGEETIGFEPFDRGTLVHRVIETCLRQHGEGRTDIKDIAIGEVEKSAAIAEFGLEATDDARVLAARIGDDWYKYAPPAGTQFITEHRWALDGALNALATTAGGMFEDPEGAHFAGTFDLVWWDEGGVVVTDFKSNWNPERAEQLVGDRQLLLYALAAMAIFGVKRATIRKAFVRYGSVPEIVVTWDEALVMLKFFAGRRAAIVAALEQVKRAVEHDGPQAVALALGAYFPRRVSGACGSCPIFGTCEKLRSAIERGNVMAPPRTREEAGEMARLRQGLKSAAERLDGIVRAAAKELGPLPLSEGVSLGYKPKNSTKLAYPVDAMIERLADMGMTSAQQMTLYRFSGVTKVQDVLRAICPTKPERDAAWSEFFDLKVGAEFGVIKDKPKKGGQSTKR